MAVVICCGTALDEEEWRAFCEYRSQKRPSLSDYELSCRVFFCDKWRRSCTYAQFRMLRVESQHRSQRSNGDDPDPYRGGSADMDYDMPGDMPDDSDVYQHRNYSAKNLG